MQQSSPFTCIMCKHTKTNGKDYTWCRNPNCNSRDCLCVHCNVEHVERWFCSRRCKEESAAPKKKRSRSTARLDEETKQKALHFDRAVELHTLIKQTHARVHQAYQQFVLARRAKEELEPLIKQLCETARHVKAVMEADMSALNKHTLAMKDMLNNSLRDVDFVQADSFEALAQMAKEKTDMQNKYRQKIEQFKVDEATFREKQREFEEAKQKMDMLQEELDSGRAQLKQAQQDLYLTLTNETNA